MTQTAMPPSPIVRVSPHGNAFTTSADVAAFFDKRHSDVLRVIERLLHDLTEQAETSTDSYLALEVQRDRVGEHQRKIALMLPSDFFEATEVEAVVGKGARRRDPAYNVSRDGFALLAMGFTGRSALAFKLAYIAAFNAMEAKLRKPYVAPLAEDLEFAKGIRIKDKILLHEQAQKAAKALTRAQNDDERRQAYWQLFQINSTLGIPMPTMEALGVRPLEIAGNS